MASDTHTTTFHWDALFFCKGRGVTPSVFVYMCASAPVCVTLSQLLFVLVAIEGQCHDGAKGTEHKSNPENLRNLSRRQGTIGV